MNSVFYNSIILTKVTVLKFSEKGDLGLGTKDKPQYHKYLPPANYLEGTARYCETDYFYY